MPLEKFSDEYNYIREQLKTEGFDPPLKAIMDGLKNVLGTDGPDINGNVKLKRMRWELLSEEAAKVMKSCGIADKATPAPADMAVIKAAVIKFLRHLYLMTMRGSQHVWLFSSPKAYAHYPSDEFWSARSSAALLKRKLADRTEQFSDKQKGDLSDGALLALNWCQKTNMVLATAKSETASMALVKKWFADDTTPTGEIETLIENLARGFKKITGTINSNLLIFTDMPSLRGATSGQDKGLLDSEAFVYAGRHEKLPIVYVENGFFQDGANVLSGKSNWARIIVHEITHLDCSTDDKKYAWAGISPGTKISVADAAVNADSWAYFAADCGGGLTQTDVNRAMNGI